MDRSRILLALPYAVLLAAAALFFVLAGRIGYAERAGQIGPDFWPRIALGLIAIVCVFEIARVLVGARSEAHGITDVIEDDMEEDAAPRRPSLLLAGGGLTLAYGAFIPYLGFSVATFVFLIAFMYVGGYRSHLAIWLSSAIGTLLIANLFLNVVYVSLPRGVPPFDRVTDTIVNLF